LLTTPTIAAASSPRQGSVAKLATLFPAARAVGLPVRLTRVPPTGGASEVAIIEFATSQEVLFSCGSLLEFADRIRLQNSDGSLDVEASVVAVQYHEGQIAVAARFERKVANWIVTI
jgi:hypothetical protein